MFNCPKLELTHSIRNILHGKEQARQYRHVTSKIEQNIDGYGKENG